VARLLLLDNYDSFTWNLQHYLAELGADVEVRLNDEVAVPWVVGQGFEAIVVSPGPGRPERAGITPALIRAAAGRTPLFGVCLGHQAIAQVFGARIVRAPVPMHGKTSPILHEDRGLLQGLPSPFEATRYHSLVVDPATLPAVLAVDARAADDGAIMALRHHHAPLWGVQFHPESVMTREGKPILAAFLERAAAWNHRAALAATQAGPGGVTVEPSAEWC
jgi:anthranilate synthase/aminodeoxychorismate synthase-like glutamine amidotransferase